MENEKYPYHKAWENYRFTVKLWLIAQFSLLPTLVLAAPIIKFTSERFFKYFFISHFIFSLICMARITLWRCPRCKKRFNTFLEKISLGFDYQCKNCGLGKYEGSNRKQFAKRLGF